MSLALSSPAVPLPSIVDTVPSDAAPPPAVRPPLLSLRETSVRFGTVQALHKVSLPKLRQRLGNR